MDLDSLCAKKPATIDEITTRVAHALQRHPLCRNVKFEIVSTPRSSRGSNWTISLHSVATSALWEASEIVADIQDAYDLAVAAGPLEDPKQLLAALEFGRCRDSFTVKP